MQVWHRWVLALGVSLALVGCGSASEEGRADGIDPGPVGVVQTALSGAMQFSAVADARVESASPTSNFGGSSRLVVDGSPWTESFLRFQVSGVSGAVTRARLRLYVSSGTSDGPAIYATGSTWSESTVTWDTRPARSGGVIADMGPAADNTFVELDVTSLVQGDGTYNLALVATSSDGITLSSSNAADTTLRPLLIVDVGDSAPLPTCAAPGVAFGRNESVSYHDTYVTEAQPTTSFFMRPELLVDSAPGEQSYFRVFTFWPEKARLRSVKLRLLPRNGSSDGPALYFTTNEWNHGSLTWNNRPALLGSPIGDAGSVSVGAWLEYDITASARQGANSYGLIATSTDGADFYSGYQNGSRALHAWSDYEWDYCARQGGGGALHAARTLGGGHAEDVSSVTSTPDGHVVMAADIYEWANFGGADLSGALALVKLRADGSHLWSRSYGAAATYVENLKVVVTGQGNILVTGAFNGTLDLGTGPLPHTHGMFIAKFSPNGNPVWARSFVATDASGNFTYGMSPHGLATDANGSLIVSGQFVGYTNFGGATLWAGPSSDDVPVYGMFLAKFSWEGHHLWSRDFPRDSGDSNGAALATDASGNVFLGGSMGANSDLGDGRLGNTAHAPFVAKYSPSGALLWRRYWADYSYPTYSGTAGTVESLAVDSTTGEVALTGVMYGSFPWSGGTFTLDPQVSYNVILGVLSASGGDRWFQHLKYLWAPRLDAEGGSLVLSADQYEATDLGGGRLHPPINGHSFVARYTMSGTFRWARVLAQVSQSPHVTLLPDGKTVGVRSFYERLFFDQKTWQSNGRSDLLFFSVGP